MTNFNFLSNLCKTITRSCSVVAILLTVGVGNAWGTDPTCTLTNANIMDAGDPASGYQSWGFTDGCSQTWYAYCIKNKQSNADAAYNYIQIKAYTSSTAYYLQVPAKTGYTIKSITMVVSSTSAVHNGGGNTATLYFSSSNNSTTAASGVSANPKTAVSGTGASSITLNCDDLKLTTGYITASAGMRIWGNVSVTYTSACANSVTINKGTSTNCTFTLSKSGSQASCDGVSTTVTVSPTSGYGNPSVTQTGASAAPTITGSSNTYTVAYGANTTGTSTINVSCSANTYTITLNKDLTPTTAGTASITATYNANTNLTSAITKPTKTGWTFGGYYTAKSGGGTQIIDASGNVIASVSGYTDASKNWKYAGNITLYAKWTCTVTWSVNGSTSVYSTQTVTYNSSSSKVASIPGPPSPASYCGDKFVGWSAKSAGSESKTTSYYDDLFTTVGGSPDIKSIGDITFYAVFADYDE